MSRKMKYRNEILDPTKLEKEFELLGSESIDIEPLFSDEHFELSLDLRRTVWIRTIDRDFSFILLE